MGEGGPAKLGNMGAWGPFRVFRKDLQHPTLPLQPGVSPTPVLPTVFILFLARGYCRWASKPLVGRERHNPGHGPPCAPASPHGHTDSMRCVPPPQTQQALLWLGAKGSPQISGEGAAPFRPGTHCRWRQVMSGKPVAREPAGERHKAST